MNADCRRHRLERIIQGRWLGCPQRPITDLRQASQGTLRGNVFVEQVHFRVRVLQLFASPPYGGVAEYEAPERRVGAVPEAAVSLLQGPAALKGTR